MSRATTGYSLEYLNSAEPETFVHALGGVFEHSPWVARSAASKRPFASVEALHAAMVEVVNSAPKETQRALIRKHPDLAERVEIGGLSGASQREQSGAGLDALSAEQYDRFQELNTAYWERFGFPFVMAVRGYSPNEILGAFQERIENDPDTEHNRALSEIARIAQLRLEDLVHTK